MIMIEKQIRHRLMIWRLELDVEKDELKRERIKAKIVELEELIRYINSL